MSKDFRGKKQVNQDVMCATRNSENTYLNSKTSNNDVLRFHSKYCFCYISVLKQEG